MFGEYEYNRRRGWRAWADAERTKEAIQFTVDNPGKTALVIGPNNYKQLYQYGKATKTPHEPRAAVTDCVKRRRYRGA